MDLISILTFTAAIFIFMASPGPGTFAVISRAIGSGFTHAVFMSSGMVMGDVIFLLLAIFGLSAIASSMSDIFLIVKYIGGIYLIYLGIKIITTKVLGQTIKSSKSSSYLGDFISGFFISLSNPKVIVFYIGFLPTFVDLSTLTPGDTVLVVTLVLVMLSTILCSYAYFASRAREAIKKPKAQKIMNRVAGGTMILIGVLLLARQ